ncbi:unnamed protein product, partial [Mesorhabditis spiculigera]
MADKTPVARRSMVGAPPSSKTANKSTRSERTPRTVKKQPLKEEEEEPQPDEDKSENSDPESDSGGEVDEKGKEKQAPPKKKRKKKLTEYTIRRKIRDAAKAKAKELRRQQIEDGLIDEEEPEVIPEPEPEEPEPENKAPDVKKYTAFQILCDHLLRKLMGKDPEEYFAFPVTQNMAPDYHEVITTPMDFSAIRQKIEDDKYTTIPELRADAELIVSNALAYNHPNTVYHLAATRLSNIVRFFFSQQHLRYLYHMLPLARDIPLSQIGLTPLANEPKRVENKRRAALHDPKTAKELLQLIPPAHSMRMTTRVPELKNSHLGFIDNKEGATVLNVLTTTDDGEKKMKLIDLVGPLDEGVPGLMQPIEMKTAQAPITYLDYGPFSSFAPQYDSTWATLDKAESDLVLRTYGDRANAADVQSLRNMVANAGDHMIKIVDELLDGLTDGEHSRAMQQLEKKPVPSVSIPSDGDLPALLNDVESLENLGLDTSVIKELRDGMMTAQQPMRLQEQLDLQGQGLLDLNELQRRRLSQPPPFSLNKVPPPNATELQLACKTSNQLVESISNYAQPAHLVTEAAIHNAIGLADDDEFLSEFFET